MAWNKVTARLRGRWDGTRRLIVTFRSIELLEQNELGFYKEYGRRNSRIYAIAIYSSDVPHVLLMVLLTVVLFVLSSVAQLTAPAAAQTDTFLKHSKGEIICNTNWILAIWTSTNEKIRQP